MESVSEREYLEGGELCRSPEEPNRDGLVAPSQSDGHLAGKKEGKIERGMEKLKEKEKEKASCERFAVSTLSHSLSLFLSRTLSHTQRGQLTVHSACKPGAYTHICTASSTHLCAPITKDQL
jgi:hypothetical protein